MELFIFSNSRQLTGIVESFEYLRWTRRYSSTGSFELKAIATPENLALLKDGNFLHKSDDNEAGIIERVELSQTDREIVTASGRFATSFLARRIVWGTETLTGDLGAAVGLLLNNHLIAPADADRAIAGFSYSATTLGISVSSQISYKNLLEAVTELCEAADVGIKTAFDPKTGLFTVTLYGGGSSGAVFSKEYENLTAQTYVEGVDEYANTALVGGEGEGDARTFVTIAQGTGEDRREVFVDARDLRSEDFPSGYTDALTFRGQSRLSELAPHYSFDADVNPHGNLRYKTDFDLGQTVKVISKPWGVAMSTRITEIEETYDADGLSLAVTFGKSELTLAQKMRSDMSGVQTSLLASSGSGELPDASVTAAKIADGAVTTGKIAAGAVTAAEIADGSVGTAELAYNAVTTLNLADGAVTLTKISDAALPTTANAYGRWLMTETFLNSGAIDLNTFLTFGGYTLFNVTAATNFPPGSWVGNSYTAHLVVQRYYAGSAVRQTITKRNAPNEIYTRTCSNATSWTPWYKIPVLNNAGEIATANLASGAVTTAKMAQEADTAITITWASGVSLSGAQNSFVNKGVVCLGFQIYVNAAVAPGGTILTITDTNFRPYTTVRSVLVPVPTFVTTVPITIESNGVLKNAASGTTLPAGYYIVSVTYARA